MPEFTRKELFTAAAGLGIAGAGLAASKAVAAVPRTSGPTLIRGAGILTMDRRASEIEGADVLIENGRIAAIGTSLSVPNAEVIEASGMILMPGMVDGHRHVWQGLQAGLVTKTMSGYGFKYNDSKLRYMVSFTESDLYLANYFGGLLAIDSGVTSLIDYAHIQYTPDRATAAAQGLKDSGIGGWFCWQTSHTPLYGPGATLSLKDAMAQRAAPPEAWRYGHARWLRENVFSDESAPLQMGLALSVEPWSVAAQKAEIDQCRQVGVKMITQHYSTPVGPKPGQYRGIVDLAEAGLLGPDLHFDHSNNITEEELRLLQKSGGTVASTVLGEFPYADAPCHWRARKAGVPAGLGIDVALAVTPDYFETVRGAYWSMYRTAEGAAEAKTYNGSDVLDFATRWGAASLRIGDVSGSIEVGKRADLVLLRTDRAGFPLFGPLAERVVNFANGQDIDSVWVAGVARKRGGKMLGVDMAALKLKQAEAQVRAAKLAATITFT